MTTGFGALRNVHLQLDELSQLQVNLIRSHAAGMGDPLGDDVVRGMLMLLAASLVRGHSGVRPGVWS